MWKVVFRGIRETLERRVCRTNVYSQSSQDNAKNEVKTSLTCQQKFLPPVFINQDKDFCGSTKSAGAKDKKHDSEWNTKHSWPEALGWTSALAAGWIVCQTLCLHKRIFDSDNKKTLKSKLYNYYGLSLLLTHISNFQPRNILPTTNAIDKDNKKLNLQDKNSQWNSEKPFGPITLEEAIKEATDEFSKTHKLVVGEYQLRYGIKALEEKRYKDALMHFTAGAKLSSPGSMFNLGLCYELGIGTLVDQQKAAKYYHGASAYDHADALYNLAVYHAQGKGGIPIDIDTARTYFQRAAKLGQVQAQHALDLEKIEIESKKNISTVPNTYLKNSDSAKNTMNNMRVKLNDFMLSPNFIETSKYEAPEYSQEMLEDATQVFLDFLGKKESSQPPVLITNNYQVPC